MQENCAFRHNNLGMLHKVVDDVWKQSLLNTGRFLTKEIPSIERIILSNNFKENLVNLRLATSSQFLFIFSTIYDRHYVYACIRVYIIYVYN